MKCDEQVLLELLDDGQPNEAAFSHLESCAQCQHRLTQLAADADSWSEVAAALRDTVVPSSVVVAMDAELTSDMPLQVDQITLDFLNAPSHPEMLGRIGRYEVERLVGAGGMGIVLKAFDTELHRPVAIKVLAPHLAHSGGARQRFAREAQSAAAVVHENVVPIHNVDIAEKLPFLVMQFVEGESLQARVDRQGALSTKEVLRIGAQIARGLAAAHAQGLVHRDVKPGNVLLEEQVDRVLISDFGLARAADDASVTRSGVIAGTPHYMSPEQARGAAIDTRSDLFGLGSVLYFMCTAHPPFRADGAMAVLHRICDERHRPVDEINEDIPYALALLIDRLLEKDPSRRPATADEVANELTSYLQDNRGRATRRRRPIRRRPLTVIAVVAACTLSLGAAAMGLWYEAGIQPTNESAEKSTEPSRSAPTLDGPALAMPVREDEREAESGQAFDLAFGDELDEFRDVSLHEELDELKAQLTGLETLQAGQIGGPPLQDLHWFQQLELAKELTTAIEQGAHVIELPNPASDSASPPQPMPRVEAPISP